jgi:DNA excision repair protein ERCC-6
VLFCKLTDDQKKLYQDYLKTDEIGKIIDGRHNIFIGLIHLRKICNHPHLFDGGPKLIKSVKRRKHRTREDESEDEDLKRRVPKNKGRRGSSSLSLSLSPDEEESDIELDPNDSFGHWTKSGKMVVVKTLLKLWKRQEHKVLLFTQSRQVIVIHASCVKLRTSIGHCTH